MSISLSQTMQKQLASIPDKTGISKIYDSTGKLASEFTLDLALSSGEKLLLLTYHIYPGIDVTYHYYLLENFAHHHAHKPETMEITHCRHGRIGWKMEHQQSLYLGEGDFSIHLTNNCVHSHITLPTGFYEGISFSIHLEDFLAELPDVLKDTAIDFAALQGKFCGTNKTTAFPANEKIEHLFLELYDLPEELVVPYARLKSQELLLYLSMLAPKKASTLHPCDEKQVQIIREIHTLLTENMQKRYTIDELSRRYLLNTSTLKDSFKAVYGMPIATYMKQYRIHEASKMLKDTNLSIAEISAAVGYENQSKFTNAFKNVVGILPTAYRKSCSSGH